MMFPKKNRSWLGIAVITLGGLTLLIALLDGFPEGYLPQAIWSTFHSSILQLIVNFIDRVMIWISFGNSGVKITIILLALITAGLGAACIQIRREDGKRAAPRSGTIGLLLAVVALLLAFSPIRIVEQSVMAMWRLAHPANYWITLQSLPEDIPGTGANAASGIELSEQAWLAISHRLYALCQYHPVGQIAKDRILVALSLEPNVKRETIQRWLTCGYLTFCLVHEQSDELVRHIADPSFQIPKGYQRLRAKMQSSISKATPNEYLVCDNLLLSGERICNADVSFQPDNLLNPISVRLELDHLGAREFARITRDNIGRRIAIVVDGEVISAPVVREMIPDGKLVISGGFSIMEARELSMILKNTLPCPVQVVKTR